jgi:hypothetical protein
MAAPAEPTGTPIEALFRSSTRLRDTLTERLDDDDDDEDEDEDEEELEGLPEDFTEIGPLPHLTLQDILASGITWKELCDYLREDQIVWMAPGVYVCSSNYRFIDHYTSDTVLGVGYQSSCLCVHINEGTAAAATGPSVDNHRK